MISMSVFKAYDVRGTVPDEFGPEIAYRVGWATAHHLRAKRIAVGRDARESSPAIATAVMSGIATAGAELVDLGLVSTPMLYFGVERLALDAGVMVTASHNPAQYNGLKICREHAIPVGGESGLREIAALCERAPAASERAPSPEVVDLREAYVEHVRSVGDRCEPLRVAIDCGNGMAAVGLEPLLEHMPLRVERLYFEPDGRFPNHPADPLNAENLRDLIGAVIRCDADLGVAFDGDADRAIFVDEKGAPVSSDLMTALLARVQLERHGPGPVLYDLRSSRATPEAIRDAGGTPERSRVGHSFIKARMREVGAVFGGELSGHFYFRFTPTLVADDGVAAFAALLDLMARERKPLSELLRPLRRYAASGEINRRVADVPGLLAVMEERYRDGEIAHLDGLSVDYPDWWFNLRPSNTEPLVRLNLEAKTAAAMSEHRDRILAEIEGLASNSEAPPQHS